MDRSLYDTNVEAADVDACASCWTGCGGSKLLLLLRAATCAHAADVALTPLKLAAFDG